jgi:hypothetical protein
VSKVVLSSKTVDRIGLLRVILELCLKSPWFCKIWIVHVLFVIAMNEENREELLTLQPRISLVAAANLETKQINLGKGSWDVSETSKKIQECEKSVWSKRSRTIT